MSLIEGLASMSEQRRLIHQMSALSNEQLRAKAGPDRHPSVRAVAQHILDERAKSLTEADHHGGEA